MLNVEELTIDFHTRWGMVNALDGARILVDKGEVVALVGESGSGKSVTSYAIMGVLESAAIIRKGTIRFDGLDMIGMSERELGELRGHRIAMIFQNPRGALNPVQTVEATLSDVIRRHARVHLNAAGVRECALSYLRQVRITDPERRLRAYPYELSGGMCQRIMIAAALACEPDLIIADEPTTGLDVTTQAAIMDVLIDLTRERHMSLILVTHDLALASEYCDKVVVMHAGHVVESAPRDIFFTAPAHPYSVGLLRAIPDGADSINALMTLRGSTPNLRSVNISGCRFFERCDFAVTACREPVADIHLGDEHIVKCLFPLVTRHDQTS